MNNTAASGYFKLAARALGMDEEQIKILSDEMVHQMDIRTEDEASEAYRK